ncbi:MAG TPA: Yip1 family protein [Spongiibacteraceae bacterium]|nr:Yip1 family protein [Spongiibacteraceae bacterium]
MLTTPFLMLFNPRRAWNETAAHPPHSVISAMLFPIIFSLLPAVAWYVGTTNVGWTVGAGEPVRMTVDSARIIAILFYFTMVASIAAIGYMIHWMSMTYGAQSSLAKGTIIAGLTAMPLFIAGAVGFHPALLIDLVVGVVALCYSVYLLYIGIPIVMKIPQERGFLFASAVVGVCMVIFMAIMGASVILWDTIAPPIFHD